MEVIFHAETTQSETFHAKRTHEEAIHDERTHAEVTRNETDNEANRSETTHDEAINTKVLRDTVSNEISDKQYINQLQITLKKTLRKNSLLKRKLQRKDKNWEKLFTKDQINFVDYNTQRGSSWSSESINKGLRLYMACGQKGYEELRRQNLPYPSIRTLQHRIQGLNFQPGILEDVINMLKIKVAQ